MKQFLHYSLILIICLLSFTSKAQEGSCAFKLEEAESLFETGILDSIPAMLRSCINEEGFDDEELARAYKLLILTYQFEDYQDVAEFTMLKFLKEFPEYELKATDPIEFKYLYNSYQTIPSFSIGIIVGGNYSFSRIIEPYSIDNTGDYKGEYTAGIKFQGGLQLKKYIIEKIDINLDIIFTAKSFEYIINQIDSKTTYTENQSIFSFPLSGTYDFKLGAVNPFIRIGVNLDYMISAKSDFEKEYTGNFTAEVLKETGVDIMKDRNPLNISALAGGGLKWNIKMGYVMLDLRYHYSFMNNVNGDNRFNDLKWADYGYIDDDFTLDNFYFSFGYVYSFYKTKQSK